MAGCTGCGFTVRWLLVAIGKSADFPLNRMEPARRIPRRRERTPCLPDASPGVGSHYPCGLWRRKAAPPPREGFPSPGFPILSPTRFRRGSDRGTRHTPIQKQAENVLQIHYILKSFEKVVSTRPNAFLTPLVTGSPHRHIQRAAIPHKRTIAAIQGVSACPHSNNTTRRPNVA